MKFLFDSLPPLIKIMRITCTQLLLVMIFTNLSLAHHSLAQEVLSRPVSVNMKSSGLGLVLDRIAKEAKIKVTYVPSVIDADQKVSFTASNEKLYLVLDRLLKPLNIKYEIDGRFIVLRRQSPQVITPKESGSVPKEQSKPALIVPADITITGRVSDEKGEFLPGVSVILKGTQRGTTTDIDGAFTINVPDNQGALVFSFVGYVSQEIVLSNQTKFEIKLVSESKSLDEIVVVGYGVQEKKRLLAQYQLSMKRILGQYL